MDMFTNIYKKACKADKIIMGEIIVISTMILPILFISAYSVPAADDFFKAYVMRLNIEAGNSYLWAALIKVTDLYQNNGGYFFANFLSYFFSPLVRGGIEALRATVFIINCFFWFSVCFFTCFVMKRICKIDSKRRILFVCILALFAMTNNDNHREVMTWYCVVVEYVLLVAGMLWGIIFFIKAIQGERKIFAVMASLIGFLMSGGALNITALNCIIYLAVGIVGFTIYNKRKISVICFCSALAGGIINAASPGNFIRHDTISGEYLIGAALKTAALNVWSRAQYLMFETPLILLLVALFILVLGYIDKGERIEKRKLNPVVFSGGGIFKCHNS